MLLRTHVLGEDTRIQIDVLIQSSTFAPPSAQELVDLA